MVRGHGVRAAGARWRLATVLALVLGLLAGALGAPGPAAGAATRPAAGGQVFAWGYNSAGQLGIGTSGANAGKSSPVSVPTLADAVAVAAGNSFSLALTSTGQVYAWGDDSFGQLGDGGAIVVGDKKTSPVPVALPAGVSAVAIDAGFSHSLALTSDGQVYAWGGDGFGQLGDGGAIPGTNQSAPVLITTLSNVVAISTLGNHTLALTAGGQVYAWGYNQAGQLGIGTSGAGTNQASPVAVTLPAGVVVVAVAAGNFHSLALTSGGQIYAWGDDSLGQLGDGAGDSSSSTPVAVTPPSGVTFVAITAGQNHSLALAAGGPLYAWGYNGEGELGDGTSGPGTEKFAPVPVALPPGVAVVTIAAGSFHSLAATADGQLYAWGSDSGGQLGDGGPIPGTTQPTPVPVTLPGGVATIAIAGGLNHSLAIGAPSTTTTVSGEATVGGAAILTATVAQNGAPVPAGGVVAFTLNGQPVGSGTTDPQGRARVTTLLPLGIAAGTYPGAVAASYAGAIGYAPSQGQGPLVVTADCATRFADVRNDDPACPAILALVNRAVIAGYATVPPRYGPSDPVQRAQVAGFLVRALGWQGRPQGPRTFSDLADLQGTDLPQAVRIVANACDNQGNCVAAGPGGGIFEPTKSVTRAEVIAFLARAFKLDPKYAWADQPNGPQPYDGVPAVHDTAVRTYVYYAGAIPDAPATADEWSAPASRAWVARVLYQALATKP